MKTSELRFHIENVNASLRLSGMEPPPELLDQQRRLLAGELTIEAAIAELDRKYKPAAGD